MAHDAPPTSQPLLYKTSDLALAASLAVTRTLAAVERQVDGRVVFEFHDDQQLQDDVREYFNMGGAVAPLRYAQTFRTLKRLVHQTLNAPVLAKHTSIESSPCDSGAVPATTTIRRRRVAR